MTNRHQGKRFVSIRSNRVESTTFSTYPQSPDALYFLRLAQIDFQYDESTSRETIRVDSIESSRINNVFNLPSKPRCAIFSKTRANRLPVWRIDSKGDDSCRFDRFDRFDRIDNIFDPPSKPRYAIFSKSRGNRLPVWRIDIKGDDSCRFHQRGFSNRLPLVESSIPETNRL